MRSEMLITSGRYNEITTTAFPSSARRRMAPWNAGMTPTSTPRVGSSKITSDGSGASDLATATFCWLPPRAIKAPQ